MKTLTKFLLFMACFCLLFSCEKPDEFSDEFSGNELKSGKTNTVTVPFKADFVGNYTAMCNDEENCGADEEDPIFRIIVDGPGNATHMGKSSIHFDFCCHYISGIYGFGIFDAYIEAANGDILYISSQGQVIEGRLPDHPDYVTSYWRDPFVILGGTGKFEGATGSGMTDDYNSSLDPNSHHHWTGTITLAKGKK